MPNIYHAQPNLHYIDPTRLIFLARGNASKPVKNAMLANAHDINPKYWSAMIMEFRVLMRSCSLKKKIQRLIFGYLFIKEKVRQEKTTSAKPCAPKNF